MEVIYARCTSDAELEALRAARRNPKLTRRDDCDYVALQPDATPMWDEPYDRELEQASRATGSALLVRCDRHGQLELREYERGALVRDLFYYDGWQRVEGTPRPWEAAVLGSPVGAVGDAEPDAYDASAVREALARELRLPDPFR